MLDSVPPIFGFQDYQGQHMNMGFGLEGHGMNSGFVEYPQSAEFLPTPGMDSATVPQESNADDAVSLFADTDSLLDDDEDLDTADPGTESAPDIAGDEGDWPLEPSPPLTDGSSPDDAEYPVIGLTAELTGDSGLLPRPEAAVIQRLVKVGLDVLWVNSVLFVPDVFLDVRQRSPVIIWALCCLGAAREDVGFTGELVFPFLQRLSRVWTIDADGNLQTLKPLGAPSLPTAQAFVVILAFLSSFWALRKLEGSHRAMVSFYAAGVEMVRSMGMLEEPEDGKYGDVEKEERRRAGLVFYSIGQWASLAILKRSPALKESDLKCGSVRPDADFPSFAACRAQLADFGKIAGWMDRNEIYTIIGATADLEHRGCCDFDGACCAEQRAGLVERIARWYDRRPRWLKEFDQTAIPPDGTVLGTSTQRAWRTGMAYIGAHLVYYHALVIVVSSPRSGAFTEEWCARPEFVVASEHAIKISTLVKTMLELSCSFEYRFPFLPYCILQAGMIHRGYIDHVRRTIATGGQYTPEEIQMVKSLVVQAKAQIKVLLTALKKLATKWREADSALRRYHLHETRS
jgi:hypothetical protein